MFLGYYMFLLSQTIKEEILPKPLLPTEIPIPTVSDTGKYRYQKNDWYHRGMQLYKSLYQSLSTGSHHGIMRHCIPSWHIVEIPIGVLLQSAPGDKYDGGLTATSKECLEGLEEWSAMRA